MGVSGLWCLVLLDPPRKIPGTLFTRGWVGLKASLDGYGRSRPDRDSIPRTFQPVASHYTGYAIPTHVLYVVSYIIVTFSKCELEEQD
jgi:hypothetical protein